MDFPDNSYKAKADPQPVPEEKTEKVVTGKVTKQKMSLGKQLKKSFFGFDAKSLAEYVIMDVLVPAARDMMFDSLMTGAQKAIYGDRTPSRSFPSARQVFNGGGTGNQAIQYHRMSSGNRREEDRPPGISRRGREAHNIQEVVFELREDAELVLEQLYRIFEKYDVVKLSNLYELVDIKPDWTDEEWGWYSLYGSKIVRVSGGYILDLPPTVYLDRDKRR